MHMTDYQKLERQLSEQLQLERRPIAIGFRESAPPQVSQFVGTQPSTCSFWRLAAEGRVFYTLASDHYNCPIGSYTHNIPLPVDRVRDLEQVLNLLTTIRYVRMEEVPTIPRLPTTPGVIVYAPLGETPVDPDVVLFSGRPGRLMLLQEAALRAGIAPQLNALPRPTCMAIPAALTTGMVASTACIGNRVYTGIDDGDLYMAVRGTDVTRIAAEAETIVEANMALLQYHSDRRQSLATH
jgi:uncharacterized protein (DUF169 family)